MKNVLYRQCILNRCIDNVIYSTTRWLPTQFCFVDNVVKLKEGNYWQNGWKIIEVGKDEQTNEQIEYNQLQSSKLGKF
jgi:hypothetical protein